MLNEKDWKTMLTHNNNHRKQVRKNKVIKMGEANSTVASIDNSTVASIDMMHHRASTTHGKEARK
jgi:hypothetical protein